ncbi:putative retrovirus-related pol polyprotein from transposon [Trichonephila clavipes]|nr:putative retrovirus-related pol polyprotein from transposon [Trichonephila clavipes]
MSGLVAESKKFIFRLIDSPDFDSSKTVVLIASSVVDFSKSVISCRMANIRNDGYPGRRAARAPPSSSPWASPIVLVRKKESSTRFYVDYRRLNVVTKKDSYPSPRIDDTFDTPAGSTWFSTLDT